jgi:pyruvate/2-oxoglutarate dehydrogenase complex dihydrolipoamide acyltransferase (E2) component
MKQNNNDYEVIPFPKMRRLEAVMFRSVRRTPMMHGLLEVDVTRAHAYLREHKAKTGEALSFTGFIITCLGKAVDEHKAMQASRLGRKHLILFEDVDVLTYIERDVAGQKQIRPCPRIAQRVAKK